jgi:hypothetical protein
MRRIALLCLLAALLVAPAAKAASTIAILRDCQDDGVLEGHYTVAQLRKAARNLPTDVAEYTDCGDVLSRAIDAAAATTAPSRPHASTSPSGSAAAPPPATPTTPSLAAPAPSVPATPKDAQAIADAARSGPPAPPVAAHGRPVAAGFTADIHRNSLPSSLLTALILVGAAVASLVVPAIARVLRRRRA